MDGCHTSIAHQATGIIPKLCCLVIATLLLYPSLFFVTLLACLLVTTVLVPTFLSLRFFFFFLLTFSNFMSESLRNANSDLLILGRFRFDPFMQYRGS
jgi:hypothetical protein